MKQIVTILTFFILFPFHPGHCQYVIKGTIDGIPDSSVIDLFICYPNLDKQIKSDTILQGYFEFTDNLSKGPIRMRLRMNNRSRFFGQCDLWVDNKTINITGKGKYLSSWIVSSNVEEQVALNNIYRKTNNLNIKLDSLSEVFITNMSNKELVDSTLKTVAKIRKKKYKIELQAIEEDPNSLSAIEILYEIVKYDSSIPKDRIMEILSQADDQYINTLYGEGILSIYNPQSIPEIGEPMIDFIANDTAGVEYSLIDFKGKYILLDFWSVACPPCIMALPETKELDLANREILTIIGINLDTHLQSWIERSRKDSLTWINLSDGKGTFSGVSTIYGVKGIPTYVLINPEGYIIDKWTGYRPGWLNDRLKKYIADLNI